MKNQQHHSAPSLHILLLAVLFLLSVSSANSKQLRGQPQVESIAERNKRIRYQHQEDSCQQQQTTVQTFCGQHQEGQFICEYDEAAQEYVTRCVKRNAALKHVHLHEKNYCGICRKCFQDKQELQMAVDDYLSLPEEGRATSIVAKVYGYPMGSWCVDRIDNFSYLFYQKKHFNEDLTFWRVEQATDMSAMFAEAAIFDGDLSLWNTFNTRSFRSMFERAYYFTGKGLEYWNTSSAVDMSKMFRMAKHFNANIDTWDTASVTNLSRFLYRAEAFDQPLNSWNVSSVQDLSFAFGFAKHFNQDLSQWQPISATTLRGAFQHADVFQQDLSQWSIFQVTDMDYLFQNTPVASNDALKENIQQSWNTNQVVGQHEMFGISETTMVT